MLLACQYKNQLKFHHQLFNPLNLHKYYLTYYQIVLLNFALINFILIIIVTAIAVAFMITIKRMPKYIFIG